MCVYLCDCTQNKRIRERNVSGGNITRGNIISICSCGTKGEGKCQIRKSSSTCAAAISALANFERERSSVRIRVRSRERDTLMLQLNKTVWKYFFRIDAIKLVTMSCMMMTTFARSTVRLLSSLHCFARLLTCSPADVTDLPIAHSGWKWGKGSNDENEIARYFLFFVPSFFYFRRDKARESKWENKREHVRETSSPKSSSVSLHLHNWINYLYRICDNKLRTCTFV